MHGTLEVQVIEGHNLRDREMFAKMDPYAVMKIGETKKRTKTSKSGGRNPHFNEKLEFNIIDGQNQMHLELFDEDNLKDDPIGHAILDLNGVFQKGIYDGWVKLFAEESGKPAGEVRLVIYFRPIQGVGVNQSAQQVQKPVSLAQQPAQPIPQQQPQPAPVAVAQAAPVMAVQPGYMVQAAPMAPVAYGSPQIQYVPQMMPMQIQPQAIFAAPPQAVYAAPPPGMYPGQPQVVAYPGQPAAYPGQPAAYPGQPMMQPGYPPQAYAPQPPQYGAQPGYPGYR